MTIFDGIGWIYWMLGTFGVVGTVAAFWFFPAITVEVLKFLASFLFTTRIGNIVLAAGVAFMVADINRSESDQAEFAEKIAGMQAAAVAAQEERDKSVAEDTRAAVMAALARQRLADAKINSDVKEFTDALPPPPATPSPTAPDFRVGAAACKLRAIAGYAGCAPEGAAGGVPQARSKGRGSRLPDWAQYGLPSIISRGPRESAQGQ